MFNSKECVSNKICEPYRRSVTDPLFLMGPIDHIDPMYPLTQWTSRTPTSPLPLRPYGAYGQLISNHLRLFFLDISNKGKPLFEMCCFSLAWIVWGTFFPTLPGGVRACQDDLGHFFSMFACLTEGGGRSKAIWAMPK